MSTLPNQFHTQLRRLVQDSVGDITTLTASVATNTADIAANAADIAANTAAIAALSSAGWAEYTNTAAAAEVLSKAWVDVPNNKNTSEETYIPAGVTQLMDSSGYIDLTDLAVGDTVIITPDFFFEGTIINSVCRVKYVYGASSEVEYTVGRHDGDLEYDFRPVCSLLLPISSTTVRDNPVKIQFWSSEAGDLHSNRCTIQVIES